jgi:hypothetical protein
MMLYFDTLFALKPRIGRTTEGITIRWEMRTYSSVPPGVLAISVKVVSTTEYSGVLHDCAICSVRILDCHSNADSLGAVDILCYRRDKCDGRNVDRSMGSD